MVPGVPLNRTLVPPPPDWFNCAGPRPVPYSTTTSPGATGAVRLLAPFTTLISVGTHELDGTRTRTALAAASETYTLPERSTATPAGSYSCALSAGPPSPL